MEIKDLENITDNKELYKIAAESDDESVAMAAVEKITDNGILADVAKYSKYESVAMAAVEKITDNGILADVTTYSEHESVVKAAFEKITDEEMLKWVTKFSEHESVAMAAFEKITDEEVLEWVAKYSKYESVAMAAVEKITDNGILADVAKYSKYESVAMAAFEKITDEEVLEWVAEYSKYESVAMAAFEKITDKNALEWVAKYSKYESVAKAAVKKITDKEGLGFVASFSEHESVAKAAVENITDNKELYKIAAESDDESVAMAAVEKITDEGQLEFIAKYSEYESVAKAAVEKITDQKHLADIVKYSKYESVAMAAVEKITDNEILESVANYSKYESVAKVAVEKITDEKWLARIAKNSEHESVAKAAVEKITDNEILTDVANYSKYESVAKAAFEKITDKAWLGFVAGGSEHESVAKAAVEKITDEWQLGFVASFSEHESVAKAAVENITDNKELYKIAAESDDESVAMAAVEKITDNGILADVANYSEYESVAMAAFEKITDKNALEWVAKYSKYESVVLAAVEKITDEEVLARVAKYSEHESVAKAAVEKIMNEERLGSVANYSKYESVAKAAFEKITDNNILADVAEYSKYESVAMAAFEKITDEEVLEWVAEYSEYESVAMAAFEKIMNGERLGSVAKAAKEKKEAEKKKREKEELAEKKKREKEELVEKKKREKEAAAKAKADKKRAAKEKAAQDESRKKKAGLMAVIAKMEQDAEKGAPETADVTDGSETAKTPYIHSDLRSLNLTRLIVLYRMGKISGDDINDDVTDDPEKTAEIFARIGKMSPEEEKEFARLVVVELFDNPSSKESLINLLPPETLADAYNGLKEQIGGKNDTRYSDAVLKEFIKKLADHMDGRSINFDRDIAQKKAYEPESLSNFCDASEKMFDARRPDLRKFLDNKKIKQIDKNKQKIKQILKEIDEFHGLDEMPPKDDAVTAPDKEREIEKQYEDLVKRLAELDPDPETLKDASKYKFLDKKGNVIPQFRDEKNKKSAEYKPGCKVDKKSKLFDIIELVRAAIARTNMAKPETPTREWLRDEMNKQLMFELFNAVHADKIRKMVLENPEQFSDPKEVIRISDELRQTGGEISELAYQAIMNDHGKRTEGFAFRLKQKLGGGGKIFGELVAKLFKPIEKIDKRREKSEKETEEDMHDATDGIDFGFSDMTDGSDGIDITDPEIVDVADGSKIADDADAETDGAAKDVLKSAIARKNRAKRIELVKKILIGGGVAFLTSAAITTIAAAAVATAGLSVAASVAVIGVVTSISMAGWQIQKWRKRQRDKGLPDDMNAMLKDKKMMASLGTTALALFAMLFGAAGLTAAAMYLGYGALVLGAGGGAVAMFKDAKASGLSAVESMMWALANVIATVGGGIGGRMFANAQINAYNERNPENTVFQTKETTETTVKEPDQTKTRTETETVYKSGAVDSSENILKGWYKSNPDLLESRLDSLMSQGMSRDDAIRYLLVAHDAGARIPTNLTFQDGSHGNNMFVGPKVFEAQGITNDMRLDLVNSINGDTVNLTDSVRSTFNTMNPAISGNNQVGPFPGAPTGPYSPYVEHSGSMETITKTVTEIIPGETKTITNTEFNSVKVPWGLGTMGLHGLFGGDKEPEETRDAPVEKPKKEKTEKTKKPKKTKTDAPKEKTTKFWNPFGGGKKVKKSEAFQRGAEIINAMQQLGERYEKAAAMADRFRDDLTGHGKIEVKTLNSGINYIEKLIKTGGLDKENKKAARSLLDMLKLESKKNGK